MGDITWVLRYFICRLLCCFVQKLIQSNNKETIKLCIKLVDSLYKGLVIWKVYRYHDTLFLGLFMSIILSCWCSVFRYRETETCLKRQSPGYLISLFTCLILCKIIIKITCCERPPLQSAHINVWALYTGFMYCYVTQHCTVHFS